MSLKIFFKWLELIFCFENLFAWFLLYMLLSGVPSGEHVTVEVIMHDFRVAVDPGGGHGTDIQLEENDNGIHDKEFNDTSGKETKLDNGEVFVYVDYHFILFLFV